MKHFRTTIFLILAGLVCTSCQVEQLVQYNNELLEDVYGQADTIQDQVKEINANLINYINSTETPAIDHLRRTSFDDFYYGEIIKEELIEKNGDWVKIRLTEKIRIADNGYILKEKLGWYSYNSPDYVYLIEENKDLIADKNTRSLIQQSIPTDISKDHFTVQSISSATKTDLLSQKELDILLAGSDLNFDGLKFKDKRLDYANFSLGSFRGTIFESCNLKYVNGKREAISSQTDFEDTRVIGGINENMNFVNWKFIDSRFDNTSIKNSNFSDCIFSSNKSGHVTFFNITFEKSYFTNTDQGYFKNITQFNTKFEQTRFTNVDFYNSGYFNTQFINCVFHGGKWQGVVFNNVQVPPSKILGGFYSNIYIYSGNHSSIIIDKLGLVRPEFSGVQFVNTNFSNSKINAWFKDEFKIFGSSSNFSNIDFKESIFENGSFGSEEQVSLINLKNCDFSKCEFRAQVKFTKCDLTGAKFPDDVSNITFKDCIGLD